MNALDEKILFSQRLQQTLSRLSLPTNKPTWFAREFNSRSINTTVSVQTAHNWLLGVAIPSQDKLQIISNWLGVSSQWLRFGEETPLQTSHEVQSPRRMYAAPATDHPPAYTSQSMQGIDDLPKKIARLTPAQKQAIDHVVDVMLADTPK